MKAAALEPSEDLNICHQSQGQGSQAPDLPIWQLSLAVAKSIINVAPKTVDVFVIHCSALAGWTEQCNVGQAKYLVIYVLYFCFAYRSYQPGSHFTPKQPKFGHDKNIVTKS